ncbi:hypothetical protein ACS0TY_013215 [Phlomoides rotata]
MFLYQFQLYVLLINCTPPEIILKVSLCASPIPHTSSGECHIANTSKIELKIFFVRRVVMSKHNDVRHVVMQRASIFNRKKPHLMEKIAKKKKIAEKRKVVKIKKWKRLSDMLLV